MDTDEVNSPRLRQQVTGMAAAMAVMLLLAGGALFVIELFTEDTYTSADALIDDLSPLGLKDCGQEGSRIIPLVRVSYLMMANDIGGPGVEVVICGVEEEPTNWIAGFVWPAGSDLSSETVRDYMNGDLTLIDLPTVALGPNWLVMGESSEDASEVVRLIGGEVVGGPAD